MHLSDTIARLGQPTARSFCILDADRLPALCGWSARVQRSYPRHLDGRGKVPDEGYWYFTGKIAPYSTVDPSLYMPLSFYSVAPVECCSVLDIFPVGRL